MIMEIEKLINPEHFPKGVTPSKLKHEPVNMTLSQYMYDIGFIEKYGTGIANVRRLPKVMDTCNTVIVTLYSPKEMLEKPVEISKSVVDEWLTQVDAGLTQELSDKEKKIVSFILKNKRISSSECQEMLSISRKMAHRYFNRLIKKSLIVKRGSGKNTYYILSQKNES